MPGMRAPRVRRAGQNTQFTHELFRRINDVQTYPIQSPQGANIIIHAHENGVTLVWRGGKRLKPAKPDAAENKPNGTSEDAVMVIDSDDDQPAAKTKSRARFEDNPEFEDEVADSPYPEVVQTLDLVLGTSVLKIAVMPLATKSAHDAADSRAAILGQKMVFAVSCVTNDVYLITLPLTPPSSASKSRQELRDGLLASKAGSGLWGESVVLLGGQTKSSDGLAIGLISSALSERLGDANRAVVASHSREASGVLRLWEIPLDETTKLEGVIEPFQTEFLPSPLQSLSFNPTHHTQLLAAAPSHGVRIYDFAQPSLPPDPEATGPFPAQGSWLVTLYQPFAKPSSLRKPIVDAAWISHGRAVFALLADGMWGIWDIDGANPESSISTMSTKLKSGVTGAALTAFSVSGYIEGTSSLRSVAPQQKEMSSGEFAPMTPHTRRQATSSLGSATTPDRLSAIHGGIRVISLPASGQGLPEETLSLWLGGLEHVCIIPAVSRFWESQLRKGGGGSLFSGTQPSRLVKIQDLPSSLLGERCCGVSLLVDAFRANGEVTSSDTNLVDLLVRGETRLVVVRDVQESASGAVGGVMAKTKRLFSKGQPANAIIVHGNPKPSTVSFNLSRAKPGTLRLRPSFDGDENHDTISGVPQGMKPIAQTNAGFDFSATLNDAADTSADFTRDVEVEMLDIMGIDNALANMEGIRGPGKRKVFFEEE